jgi:hypothetical protein
VLAGTLRRSGFGCMGHHRFAVERSPVEIPAAKLARRTWAVQQADAADEAGASDGASQLIRSVGPTVRRVTRARDGY